MFREQTIHNFVLIKLLTSWQVFKGSVYDRSMLKKNVSCKPTHGIYGNIAIDL